MSVYEGTAVAKRDRKFCGLCAALVYLIGDEPPGDAPDLVTRGRQASVRVPATG